MKNSPCLIGLDLGRTECRAWAYDADGDAIDMTRFIFSPFATENDCLAYLDTAVRDWLGHPPEGAVLIALRDDWQSPVKPQWIPAPCRLTDIADNLARKGAVHIVPGICQKNPADLAASAGVALLGLDEVTGLACLPGPFTRHLLVEDDRLIEFTSEMTSGLIDLLQTSASLNFPGQVKQVRSDAVFLDWVERSLDSEHSTAAFSVAAAIELGQLAPEHHTCALTGLLVGADVASHYEPGDEVTLIADGDLARAYKTAFDSLQVDCDHQSAENALKDGIFEIADMAGMIEA